MDAGVCRTRDEDVDEEVVVVEDEVLEVLEDMTDEDGTESEEDEEVEVGDVVDGWADVGVESIVGVEGEDNAV